MSVRIQQVYVGESIREEAPRILRVLKRGKNPEDCWLWTLSDNPHDEVELIHSFFLISERVRSHLPKVVGLAGTKEEALELLVEMVDDCRRERGDLALKAYLKEGGLEPRRSRRKKRK